MTKLFTANGTSLWDRHLALCSVAWFCFASAFGGFTQRGFGAPHDGDATVSMATIRQLVERNDALISLIKMDFVVRFSSSNPEAVKKKLERMAGGNSERKPKTPASFSHWEGVWAQDGVKQYLMTDYWYTDGKKDAGGPTVIDGEVYKWADDRELMSGGIARMEHFPWFGVEPLKFGQRDHDWFGEGALLDVLRSENAVVCGEEEINGRRVFLVVSETQSSSGWQAKVKIWIDREAGVPLQVHRFLISPDSSSNEWKLFRDIKDVELHKLPNGGWITIKATRITYMPDDTRTAYLDIDPNNITNERENIPDSLFSIEFPENARVYNDILGLTIQGESARNDDVEKVVDTMLEELETRTLDDAPVQKDTTTLGLEQIAAEAEKQLGEPVTYREVPRVTEVTQGNNRRALIAWIGGFTFLVAFTLTVIVLIFCSRSENAKTREDK